MGKTAPARLPEHPSLDELVEFFKNDVYAYKQTGCRIVEGWAGHGVCEMELVPEMHFNAQGFPMGGAIFTLADYALAVASVCGQASSVSVSTTIEFIKATRAKKLIATCDADAQGHKVGFFTIDVVDDEGEKVAKLTATCYRPIAVAKD